MADDNDKNNGSLNNAEEVIGILILLLLAFQVVNNAPEFIQQRFGVDITNPQSFYQEEPITPDAGPGLSVINGRTTEVYQTADGILRGTQPDEARGKLVRGPVLAGGVYWWEVDYINDPDGWVQQGALLNSPPLAGAVGTLATFKIIATILSLLFIAALIYNIARINQIRTKEREELEKQTAEAIGSTGHGKNGRWEHIIKHVESANENDWRTAIMEADIMLGEMLETMGYMQDTIGDKLKAIEKSDFTTLDQAWEAHKVRNKIAHEGREYSLTQRDAQRVIGLYEDVFVEFSYI